MAKGYRWVRVQLPQKLHDRVAKTKGRTSWDEVIEKALINMVAGEEADRARKEVP
jgi:hypothetical protein